MSKRAATGNPRRTPAGDAPVYVISVAAELAGMHAQTLRQYDRLGLVVPRRTSGGSRRYSGGDIERLREIQSLSQEDGISLAGIQRIMELENQVEALRRRLSEVAERHERLLTEVRRQAEDEGRVFAAGPTGEVVVVRRGSRPRAAEPGTGLVLWRPKRPH